MSKRVIFLLLFFFGLLGTAWAQFIAAPALQCVQNNNTNGDIILNWTNPTNPCGPFVQDTIFASDNGPNGPFDSIIIVTTPGATSFTLTNYLAIGQNWFFYMSADYNCPGSVSLHSDTVENKNPAIPQIVDVTVSGGQSLITWQPDPSPQTSYYIVYYYLPNGNASPIDTVYGRNNTSTIDPLGNPNAGPLVYTIAAVDSCGDISSYSIYPQNTIYTTAAITTCQQQITINWNQYNNWPSGVEIYQVWLSRNDSAYTMVATADTGSLSFIYTTFNDGDSISIFVRAVSAADTNVVSNSNVVSFKAIIIQPPAYIYITNLTVDASNYIDITWTVDTMGQLLLYKINRGVDGVDYSPANQFPCPAPLPHFESYTDSIGVYPNNNPYYYQVAAFDSCQNQYTSPYGETVNLTATLRDFFLDSVSWNPFVLDYATVMRYNLYRDIGQGYQLIKVLQPSYTYFLDSVQQFLTANGTFCYKVEAVYFINLPSPSNYSDTLSSFSNLACVISRPIIYVPNAFSPGSNVEVNTTFKPTIIYGAPTNYTMLIFNRWGEKIFESDEPDNGWDGSEFGKPATMGGYAYLIQFTAADGVKVERKGMVLLVR